VNKTPQKTKSKSIRRKLFYFVLLIFALFSVLGWVLWKGSAVEISENVKISLTNEDNTESISEKLENQANLKYPYVFKLIAEKVRLDSRIKEGNFTIEPGFTLVQIIKTFLQAKILTTNVVLRGSSSIETVCETLGSKLEPSKEDFFDFVNNDSLIIDFGFTANTIASMIIPNTYNMFWYTSPREVFAKLHTEYNKFWNEERLAQAKTKGLNPLEVSILASIVDKETNKVQEMPRVAGVYLNRLEKGWKLQADPTVKFALNNPSLKRILRIHTQLEHPYNTYYIQGLPPGPICVPSMQALQAVLNAEKHDYMFFCASPDYSGLHIFAKTDTEHINNANRYHKFLNQQGIK